MIKIIILLVLFAACSVCCNVTSTCNEKEVSNIYLDLAMDMISKAKYVPSCNNCPGRRMSNPMDCADVLEMGHNKSGIYEIWPINRVTEGNSIYVYCDLDTDGGGWTVIQRRGDFKRPKDYFYQDWKNYKEGFGNIQRDFWLGNEHIYALTNQKLYSARFDLKAVEQNKTYALYENFWIDDEMNKYMLRVFKYSGDAGDAFGPHNNSKFTTKDQDNDIYDTNCAERFKGAWWYTNCHSSNLNGLYHKGKHESYADGINWNNYHESLEWTEIKIRPKNFKLIKGSEETPM